MKTDELRERYLEYFVSRGHTRCDSDVLVPTWDPSVLFTPAGMNQFKDHFLGKVKLEFTRATTCQKCLRTGDIDNVGRTAYHHTFFEMLGNFSFGDYFKRDAIMWAWEFLTSDRWLGVDPGRLSTSVYVDDDEAANIWINDIGVSPDRVQRMGEHDNFWPAGAPSEGPDGVCGPCSEIFYHDEHGNEVEIWNLVFTQFNRVGDPPDNLRPLPSKNIDTGMGLERAAACLQGVQTNYHIDILRPIVEAAADVCGLRYEYKSDTGRRLRRITDHIRACAMAIHENVYPGNQKEKYVIRRLLRRAVLDGHQMGVREPFLYQLVPAVAEQMRAAYPELAQTTQRVAEVIKNEETNFFSTLDAGLARIAKVFDEMKSSSRTRIDGTVAADLYQTFGVPPEVFETMAAEHNLAFDWEGYRSAMEAHGEASGRAAHIVMGDAGPLDAIKKVLHDTPFLGYEATTADAEIKFIVAQNRLCDHVHEVGHDADVTVVLDRTPFYGESGGQVGDIGELIGDDFRFVVCDTQKSGNLILHIGHLADGQLRTGAHVQAKVDLRRRAGIRRAHSATHILHYALQRNLGSHAQQQGSKVDDDWLRFDFTNMTPVDEEHLAAVERDSNARVAAAEVVTAQILPLAEAGEAGAMMLFGEKYPDPVRMVSMGNFSRELCGGTHLNNTSEVGHIEIVTEEGVAAGTRRITALTGEKASTHAERTRAAAEETARLLDVSLVDIGTAVRQLVQRQRDLKKQMAGGGAAPEPTHLRPTEAAADVPYPQVKAVLREAARTLNVLPFDVPQRVDAMLADVAKFESQLQRMAESDVLSADALLATAAETAGTKIVVAETPGANVNLMRQLIDQIRRKAGLTAVLLATVEGDSKVILVAGVNRDLVARGISAGDWVRQVAPIVGGGGGGKPEMAQAGGKYPDKLPAALEKARAVIEEMLATHA